MITYFKSVTGDDKSYPSLRNIGKALERIKEGTSKALIYQVRQSVDKESRNLLKKKLPAICFSGEFSSRADNAITKHSGFICLDFDGYIDEYDMGIARDYLCEDKHSYSVFTSPSGNGLKVIVKMPEDIENHKSYFNALEQYYNMPEFDKSCKNISRVCYESYDPELFLNENSEVWDKKLEEKIEAPIVKQTIRIESDTEVIKRLRIWWEKSHGMTPGEKNTNLFIFASALNKYGVAKHEALSAVMVYDEGGKEAEIQLVLNSAYKDTSLHGTEFFEDTAKVDSVILELKKGVPVSKILELNKNISEEAILSVVDSVDKKYFKEFWNKNSKGVVVHLNHLYKGHLESNGYFKFYPSGSDNFVFVKLNDNIIKDTTEDLIKDDILEYLHTLEDMSIFNYFADQTKLFRDSHLSFLARKDFKFMRDTEDTAYLYYKNSTVKVTKDNIEVLDYMDIDGYIWERQKVDRSFSQVDFQGCDYQRFIGNLGNNEPDRVRSIESTIGFLLHTYKPSSFCPAVILNDEIISDNPEGGTGKGIFRSALNYVKQGVIIDGKSFDFKKSFSYSRVSVATQLLTYDDVPKGFDFEKLFPIITEGMTIEKKNKDEILIPFKDSPKILITTNYAIKGSGNSFDRRKWELEFAQHYNKDFTPRIEFGHDLFTDWTNEEWLKFDNYMAYCQQQYLKNGLIECNFKNLEVRKFISSTNHDFYDWANDKDNMQMKAPNSSIGQDLYNKFTNDNPDYGPRGRYHLTLIRFYKFLDMWGEFKYGQKPTVVREATGKRIQFNIKLSEQTKIKL
jgi:hypothetical protein